MLSLSIEEWENLQKQIFLILSNYFYVERMNYSRGFFVFHLKDFCELYIDFTANTLIFHYGLPIKERFSENSNRLRKSKEEISCLYIKIFGL